MTSLHQTYNMILLHSMITLSESRQQFIGHLKGKGRSSATILAYGKDVEQLVSFLEKEGVVNPADVTLDQLNNFMAKLAKENYTAKSISRKTNSTKTFFKFMKNSSLIEGDPAQGLEHPSFETKPPRILTKLEYRALRDAARGDIRMSAIIELLLQSGIRIGELSKVRVEDVKLEGDNPNVYVQPEEGSVERTIPLTKPASSAIAKYLEIRPKTQSKSLFITKTGRPLLVRNIRTAIDRYFRLAGIKGAKVNDLRHTWVSSQLASGISLVMISKLAGHKRVSTTEKYLQYTPSRTSEDKIKLEEL
ncbi:MAG: Tyrosine recombinase XerC [Candidatus Daviesbacteria bacterium GW2011_GWB1_41_5]|uniref:Tyrosine recombinase XerC n=2 Tax=Candidatus Daviesiibacteriota TaxID=1752718 RepID=A0A0G0WMW2_9BACT|nr:MAG: Tyrosine recombinase XerC [Candidatus Daviesbacteria bacterium GW2011_GWB1_41_5]